MKTKIDKKVNRAVKKLNRQLERDVFGNRFWLQQIKKNRNTLYYLYMLRDREQPERDRLICIHWLFGFKLDAFVEMNNFIIESDFWKKYREKNN